MKRGLLSDQDRAHIAARGITEADIIAQIETLRRGFPFVRLQRPCTIGDGITVVPPADMAHLSALYAEAARAGRMMKFVPASGAASRMFQRLLSLHSQYDRIEAKLRAIATGHDDADYQDFFSLLRNIKQFAFYDDLHAVMARRGLHLDALLAQGSSKEMLDHLLTPQGLNYANLPKGLLKFHRYPDHCRTPLEEHLVEAASTVQDQHQVVRLHVTVSPAHHHMVEQYLHSVLSRYEHSGVQYEIQLSQQKSSTDTIAVDLEHQPFRDRDGHLLFRPAGHGALLENLNDLQGDIIFLKNIDNVVPDHLKADTYVYTRMLGGYLIALQRETFGYLDRLAAPQIDAQLVQHVFTFARDKLSISIPAELAHATVREQAAFLFTRLNQPLRVCGVVRNTGEPGGGPFWVEHDDSSVSLQIIETSQVDVAAAEQQAILESSTHFNPVNLVCGVRDYRGQSFDLKRFRDPNTGFISTKSYAGRALKALELPGLWNGAMAHWNTVFVEVPLSTFTPVKTVLDLLRPEHQPC